MAPKNLNLDDDQLCAVVGRIYDAFRNASLSRRYYSCRLINYKRINLAYEIVLAVGTSTTVAAWTFWQVPGTANFWTIFAGVIAVLAVIKPFLPLSSEIERLSKLHIGYSDLFYDLKTLVEDMKTDRVITKSVMDLTKDAEKGYKKLALQDDPKPRKRLLRRSEKQVRRAFPASYFWNPLADTKEKAEQSTK